MAFLVVIGLTAWITSNRTTDATASSGSSSASSSVPSWLFSLSSDAGSMKKNADGSYLLTLTGADDAITAFTDRPVRDTAVVPLGRAVIAWPQVFASAAPNAVLVEHDPSGASDSFVVVLTDPKLLNASTVTFRAELVQNDVQPASLKPIANAQYVVPPTSFGTVSLFIDNVTTTTVNYPAMSVCISSTGGELTPPGSVTTSSETGSFDNACKNAGGTVEQTPGTHITMPS
ncbi:unannotated protein [freshwater metagenome]|uniref:Unannotated protein n=1 Tax=freshwater metagenome TaxID=449393 RepID=A0A6J7H6X8_9ZZZZ